MSEKTEPATPRRLRQARRDGDSPISSALTQAISFVVVLALVPAVLEAMTARVGEGMRLATQQAPRGFSAFQLVVDVLMLSLPLIATGALAALTMGFVQTGGVISVKKLNPDLGRANPLTGLKHLWSAPRFVSLARALIGTLLVAWLTLEFLLSKIGALASGVGNAVASAQAGLELAGHVAWLAALVGLGLAGLDVLATRHSWLQRLRMSRDEVKREHRQAEGDPELKGARQRAHQEVLAGSMLNAVRNATVVIVNPTHLATALSYDRERDQAPTVVSKGAGDLAKKIIEAAHAYNVPVVRDVPVARALSELEVGEEIPEELYEAVAEVLREVFESEARNAV